MFKAILVVTASIFSMAQVDKEKIRLKIRDQLKDIKDCHQNSPNQSSDNKGKIVIDFEIDDAGAVKSTTVNEKKTTLKNTAVQTCITDKFKSLSFPPAPKGKTITVSYPFVFDK